MFGTSFGKHGKLVLKNIWLYCFINYFCFIQEWFAKKLNEISNPESNQYLVPKLNTSKTDNNNLPLSLVETLLQLSKDFLDISDNILLYLYLEVSINHIYLITIYVINK